MTYAYERIYLDQAFGNLLRSMMYSIPTPRNVIASITLRHSVAKSVQQQATSYDLDFLYLIQYSKYFN